MVLRRFLAAGITAFFISGCAVFQQERVLKSGKICSKTQRHSALVFVEAVPGAFWLNESWELLKSVIVASLHPLEVFGGKDRKDLGLEKVLDFTRSPRKDLPKPGEDEDKKLLLIGDLEPTNIPERKIALLEARYVITSRLGEQMPEEVYRRKFSITFDGLTNCIYSIEEIDKEWVRIK